MKNLLSVPVSEGLCNCRIKFYPDKNGNWYPVEKMTSLNKVFNPLGLEKNSGYFGKTFEASAEVHENDKSLHPDKTTAEENKNRARLRSRSKLLDLVRCNLDFNYFCTLTFNGEKVQRENYNDVIKRFSQWTDNRVRRNGLKYVAVVEKHKRSNGLHFHLICNSALDLVDSGTVSVPSRSKPIKISTADKYKIPQEERKVVYNIPSWSYGFTTALQITGDPDRVKVSSYLQKYLTKDCDKIGGRWYYSGGNLIRPRYSYCDDDYFASDFDYEIIVPGNNFRVFRVPKNGSQIF